MDAVLSGDLDRFAGIVDRWQAPLVSLAWRFCRDRALADEWAQDAFLRVFRSLQSWKRDSEFSTWLFAVALNVYRTQVRKLIPPGVELDLERAAMGESSDTALLSRERDELVRKAVTTLPEIYRTPIIVYYFRDEDLASTARILDLKEGTVKARLHRARRLIEEKLERWLH